MEKIDKIRKKVEYWCWVIKEIKSGRGILLEEAGPKYLKLRVKIATEKRKNFIKNNPKVKLTTDRREK